MKKIQQAILIAATLVAGAAAGVWLLGQDPGRRASAGEHGAAASAADYERGPHRGRMLRDGDFALEITIFEDGVPPQFRVYPYHAGKPLDPREVGLSIELARLGGRVDRFTFRPEADYLIGDGVVKEPHSFDVRVVAAYNQKQHEWTYPSYEGRTQISKEAAVAVGLVVEPAGPAALREEVPVTGRIALNTDAVARVEARFPGLVREVRKNVNDTVTAGEVLATVESNESLQTYAVKAPIGGVVLARTTSPGAVAGSAPLFEVADLTTVWADLHLFARDATRVRPGQPVTLRLSDDTEVSATVDRILPLAQAASQTVVARAVLQNRDGRWRPGQALTGKITVATRAVPLAVKTAGLQRFRDFTVVFAQVGDIYEVRMLELGQRDGDVVEVLRGIEPNELYVTENSFLIKADIDKAGASHDH